MTEPLNWSITTEQSATSTSDLAKIAATNGAPSGSAFLAIEQTAGGYVPHRWANMKDAIRWINDAGGMAVIGSHKKAACIYRFCFAQACR